MKIFIVCNKLGGGGAERVAALLATGLSQRGHQIYLITDLLGKIDYSVAEEVTLLQLFRKTSHKYIKWTSTIFLLRQYIRDYSPDVIIGIMEVCTLVSKLATIGKHVPVIMTEHNAFERPAYEPLSFSKDI